MSQAQEEIVDLPVIQEVVEQKQEDPIEIEVTDAEQETPAAPKQEAKPFDPKTDRVEFNTPEQQAKYNDTYKQMKMSDARNQMLTDMLTQATKRLDEVESRFKQTDAATAENMLLSKIKQARDAGDDVSEFAAINELVDFKADKKISERVNIKPQPRQEDSPDARYVQGLMQEVDHTGQPVRPWLNENHPEFNNALSTLESIKSKYIGDPYALPKTLSELDQLMKAKMTKEPPLAQPHPRAPNPMQGGNLTNQKQKATIKMTRQELDIAKKLGVDPKKYAMKRDELAGRK